MIALAPLAAQERQSQRGVVAAGAEALLAVTVGQPVAREHLQAGADRRSSRSADAPVSTASKRLPCRWPVRSLLPCGCACSTLTPSTAICQRRSGSKRGMLSHCRVVAWRSFMPA